MFSKIMLVLNIIALSFAYLDQARLMATLEYFDVGNKATDYSNNLI